MHKVKPTHITKKRPTKVLDKKPAKMTEYADWMDQDNVGEDPMGWTPTGIIGPQAAMLAELMGEDRPEWTQSEEQLIEDEEMGMRTDS